MENLQQAKFYAYELNINDQTLSKVKQLEVGKTYNWVDTKHIKLILIPEPFSTGSQLKFSHKCNDCDGSVENTWNGEVPGEPEYVEPFELS
jgi:hypothetical protein